MFSSLGQGLKRYLQGQIDAMGMLLVKLVSEINLDWLLQLGDVTGVLEGFIRAPRKNIFNFNI